MVLSMRLLDWEFGTFTTKPVRLTPKFPKCWVEKKRAIQYAVQQIRLVIWLKHIDMCSFPRFQYKVTAFFSSKTLAVSLTLCQKVVNTAGGILVPGGENLRKSDFDDSKIFQS